ncbi:unnamed protein product [Urochloa humidicola]
MMNYPGHAAAGPWCYLDDAGEAAAAAHNTTSSFADMIADHYFTDDLFQLAWSGSRAPGSMTMMQPAAPVRSPPPEERFDPPSEGQMAAWLCAIVRGDGDDCNGCREVPAAKKPSNTSTTTTADKEEKLPLTEGMGSTEQEMREPPAGGSSRRSHNGEAHKLTEKRRRDKINERLRTLQQLVPGCDDKSNQTVTLDQTIQYVKSLQSHVQAMSPDGPPRPPPPPLPPAYHVMPPPPPQYVVLAPAAPATATTFPAMLQLPGYPVPMPVMMPAAAAPPYPAIAPPRAPGGASHRQGSRSSKRKGSSRSLLAKKH